MAKILNITIVIMIIVSSFIFIYVDMQLSNRVKDEIFESEIEKVEQAIIQSDEKIDVKNEYSDKNIDKSSEIQSLDIKNQQKTFDENSVNMLDVEYQEITSTDKYNDAIIEDGQEIDIEINAENIYIEDINNEEVNFIQVEDEMIYDEQTSKNSYFDEIYSAENVKYIRTDSQSDVYVDVVFLNLFSDSENLKENLVFDVFLNTHTYDISEKNLEQKVVFKNDKGLEVRENIQWLPVGISEGHHVFGKLIVPNTINGQSLIDSNTQYFKIIMTDVAGAEKRIFVWTNEEVDFKKIVR